MKTLCAITLIIASIAATPALADRPFGSSSHGPAIAAQYR